MRTYSLALLVVLVVPACAHRNFAENGCAREEAAAIEREDRDWLVAHLVMHHHLDAVDVGPFVNDLLRKNRDLNDIKQAGRVQAEQDLAGGLCNYLVYGGPPRPENEDTRDSTLRSQGIQPVRVASCLVSDEDRAFCDGYNAVTANAYLAKYGLHVEEP